MLAEVENMINKNIILKIEVGKYGSQYLIDIISRYKSKVVFSQELKDSLNEARKFIDDNIENINLSEVKIWVM